MKANELRIGNIICSKGTDETGIYIIEVIYKDYCLGKYEKITHRVRQCFDGMKGIPLAEEWMLKFGFERFENEYYHSYKEVEICVQFDPFSVGLCRRNDWAFLDRYEHIQYVHQLQNLYFALTGNELELKP